MSKTPVPVLTKKQQKLSLSAKKTKTKQTIRNILASPYSKYWPVVSNGHYQMLKNALNKLLPKLLPEKVKIPWKELKAVPKSSRKTFREKYISVHLGDSQSLHKDVENREGLMLGINDVTKALENQKAKSVLITEDVLPRLMVDHVIDQSVLLKLPILVVPSLRVILKEKCGISSVAIAFTDSPRYKVVQAIIEDISKKYPVPETHINFDRCMTLDESVIVVDDSMMKDISKTDLDDNACIIEDEVTKDIITQKVTDASVIIIEDSFMEDSSQVGKEKPENSITKEISDTGAMDSTNTTKAQEANNATAENKTDKSVIVIADHNSFMEDILKAKVVDVSETSKGSSKNTMGIIIAQNLTNESSVSIKEISKADEDNTIEDILEVNFVVNMPEESKDSSKTSTVDSMIVQNSTSESDAVIKNHAKDISTTNIMNATNKFKDVARNDIVEKVVKDCDKKSEEPVKNIHLIRTNKDKRVFISGKTSEGPPKNDVDSSGFLAFSDTKQDARQKVGKNYASLKVLRVKGDNNRNKRRIQAMKEMKSKGKKLKKNN